VKEVEVEKEEEKTPMWKIILIVFLVLVFLFLLFIGYGAGINNRFYKILIVTSGSMSPTFDPGDLIVVTKIDPENVKVGDIVTFQTKEKGILTHRVVEIKTDGEIVTKGDANQTVDFWSNGWKLEKVEIIYRFKIQKLGYAVSGLQNFFSKFVGLLPGNTTGAYLSDTEKTGMSLTAGEWAVPTPSPALAAILPPTPSVPPNPTESTEPSPTESSTVSPSPTATESIEPTPSPTATESIEPTPVPTPSEEVTSPPPEETASIENQTE
jgi:signal peptidase